MEGLLYFIARLILGIFGAIVGYFFFIWIINKLRLKKFINTNKRMMLFSNIGQLIIVVGLLVLINLVANFFKRL
jgi:ABC-type antimicrobial peptide transport system permease subunit